MTTTKDKIRDAVNDLIQTKRISEPNQLSVPDFHTFDLYPTLEPYFSAKAKLALSNKVTSTIHQWNEPTGDIKLISQDQMVHVLSKLGIKSTSTYRPAGSWVRKYARAHCFGFATADETKISSASLKLVDIINHMSMFNFIKASLMHINLFELTDALDHSIKKYAVVSYLCIPAELEEQVKNTYGQYMFEEGGIPPEYK